MYTTLSSKGQMTVPVEIRSMFWLNTGEKIDFAVFDKNHVEMMPKKASARLMEGIVKCTGKHVSLLQMDESIAVEMGR